MIAVHDQPSGTSAWCACLTQVVTWSRLAKCVLKQGKLTNYKLSWFLFVTPPDQKINNKTRTSKKCTLEHVGRVAISRIPGLVTKTDLGCQCTDGKPSQTPIEKASGFRKRCFDPLFPLKSHPQRAPNPRNRLVESS